MLKFDNKHKIIKNIKYKLTKLKNTVWPKQDNFVSNTIRFNNIIIGFLISVIIATPFAAFKISRKDCDLDFRHAHLYLDNETKIERYIENEQYKYKGLVRLEDYREITKEEAELLKYLNKNNLSSIEENYEQLQKFEEAGKNHKEYRYSYTEKIEWSTPIKIGKGWSVIHHSKDVTRYSWTTDKTKNLTGEERDVSFKYYGIKVYQDENGKYQFEKSELVDSISDLPEGYDYIDKTFYVPVDSNTKEVLDYEEGNVTNAIPIEISGLTNEEKNDSEINEMLAEEQNIDVDNDGADLQL